MAKHDEREFGFRLAVLLIGLQPLLLRLSLLELLRLLAPSGYLVREWRVPPRG